QSVYAINAQDSSFVNFTARNTSGFFLNASTGLELANIYVVNASIAIELNQTTDSTFENITSSQIIMSDDSQDNTLINVSYTSGTFGSATFVEEQYFYIRAIDSASSLLSNASIVIENASTTVFTGETSGASEGYASVRAQLIRAYSNSTLDNTYQITATLPGFSDVVKNIVLNQTNGAYSVQFSGIGACAAISNSATYTLRQNIYTNGSCFNITADTVTINGNGFGVYGGFANITGFDIQADDVTLTGLTISQFNRGIHIPQTVQGFILEDSTLEDNYYAYADNASTDSTIENVAFVNSTHVLKLNGTTDGLSIINTTINLQLSTAIAFNQSVQTQDTLFDEVDIIHTNGSLTNISGTVDGLYEIGVISTYYQIGITNLSLVRFKRNINATNLDLDSDILFAYNYFKLNDTRQSQMNKTANITLYALNEGSQRSIIRNNVLCDEDTTPGCTEGTSIDSSPFTFNVSDFRNASNYSVRGFVVKLNYPELDDRVRQDDIQFQFNATPAYGSILDNCSFQINDVEYDSFSRAELSAKSTFNVTVRYLDVGDYSWEVFCDDNASLRQNATSNFSVRSSGGGGGGGSSGTIGLNGNSKWWVNTFEDDATNLTQVTHYLRALDGIRIRVKGESHHVGVVYLTSTMATINISSKTQQINLTVNETRRIDLDEDNESDIRVTLHEISKNTAGSLQANVSVVSVVPGSPGTDYVIPEFAPVTNNSQTQENMTIVATQGGSSGPTGPLNPAGKKKNTQLVVILVVFTLGASIYAVMKSNAKKSENKIEEMKPREKVLTAVPLMDPHLYQSLAATYTTGQSIESMKFHLFERGYSRENADQIMNQFMLDHYVKTALEHGLKPEQIREALRAAGWPEYLLSQVFYEQEK
ncbi:MAG TPA: hypothetical protein VK158_04545, partial [Acidobacteriota bacterium]|nr:hypothetical protein [Acidobacteriota bacterium]